MMEPWRSHHWVANPYTRTERRWAIDPRQPRQNVVLFHPRYQNIDTGKFDSDKLPTLYHSSLAELIEPEVQFEYGCADARHASARQYRARANAWFAPKDSDFDEECARDDREREQREKREQEAREALEAQEAVEREKARLKAILEDEEYKRVLADAEERVRQMQAEERAIKERQQLRARIDAQMRCNIRPNKWIVK